MNDTSQHPGRPEKACLTADKWQLLNDLTAGAKAFGLGHRTLSVLKALMTFLPGREISTEAPAVVFPSNRTLSERLNGMPESTLRRHLAALIKAGIVSRQDSPNRKRYARFADGQGIAFGFDLSPLARAAKAVVEAATAARKRAEARAVLHARLMQLCYRQEPTELTEDAKRALRRQDNNEELTALIACLEDETTEELSVSNGQNERHIQKADKKTPVLEDRPSLADVRARCSAAQSFYPGGLDHWTDAIDVARRLAPMMGIESSVVADAERKLGLERAAATILQMLEKLPTLRNPGGYLRRLAKLGADGRFSISKALRAENCQLTIPKNA
jgi:replication initiation protein RepC